MASAAGTTASELEYPESDGLPMAESDLHRDAMFDLIGRLQARYADDPSTYVTGNMMVYYVEGQPAYSLAPDCFMSFGVAPGKRRTYKVWQEGAYPTVVFEITSNTTMQEDISKKMRIYERVWGVREAFYFDPTEEYLEPSLYGVRWRRGTLETIRPVRDRLPSKELGITMERDGVRLVLRDSTGKELPLPGEVAVAKSERKAKRAAAALRKSETALEIATAEARREREQRESAEAEIERLRALLAATHGNGPRGGNGAHG